MPAPRDPLPLTPASAESAHTLIGDGADAMQSAQPHPLLAAWNAHSLMEWRCGDLRSRFLHGADSNSNAAAALNPGVFLFKSLLFIFLLYFLIKN